MLLFCHMLYLLHGEHTQKLNTIWSYRNTSLLCKMTNTVSVLLLEKNKTCVSSTARKMSLFYNYVKSLDSGHRPVKSAEAWNYYVKN